jgi:hypothetical protein
MKFTEDTNSTRRIEIETSIIYEKEQTWRTRKKNQYFKQKRENQD